jgi:hypothetical protein
MPAKKNIIANHVKKYIINNLHQSFDGTLAKLCDRCLEEK